MIYPECLDSIWEVVEEWMEGSLINIAILLLEALDFEGLVFFAEAEDFSTSNNEKLHSKFLCPPVP